MLDFDCAAAKLAKDIGGLYRRYSDDIFFLSPPAAANDIERALFTAITPLGLEFKPSKTERTTFERLGTRVRISSGRPFPYLGFIFDGQRRLIRSSSLGRYWRNTRKKIKIAKRITARSSPSHDSTNMFRRTIYKQTTHLGRERTFLRYAYRADRVMKGGAIRKQVKPHWKRIITLLGS